MMAVLTVVYRHISMDDGHFFHLSFRLGIAAAKYT